MTPEEYLGVGVKIELGSHAFSAEEIKRYATKYDPQRFHVDEDAARQSVLGGLCASGWHTAATWMRLNIAKRYDAAAPAWDGPGPLPTFGPSPGIRDLKWIRPVYAGDTITYYRTGQALRAHPKRAGWQVLAVLAEGFNADGEKVIEFTSSVLIDTGGAGST